MPRIAADEAKGNLAQLIKGSETGQELVIVNRGEPLARLEPSKPDHDVEQAVAAADRILRTARRIARSKITVEEIKAWTNEGRP